ncbi:hypothetical protein IW138_002299 [Coemansia sp. RSA 986]|nr:hypothetical protein IW138_002299 [Coemansia sp. RSA 986]
MDYTNPSSFGGCYRHRRNSDVFLEKKLSRHSCLSDSNSDDEDSDEASSSVSALSCNDGYNGVTTTAAHDGDSQMVDQHVCNSGTPAEYDQPSLRVISKRNHLLSRTHSTSAHLHYHRAKSESVNNYINTAPQNPQETHEAPASCFSVEKSHADIHDSIKDNTQDEPMSSAKALHILSSVLSSASSPTDSQVAIESQRLASTHDAACKHCISEAMATTHKAAAKGIVWHGGQSELRMNLGNGRNAIYVAPCERHLECPLDKVGKYLIHTNKSKIMTDMSKVEFGICVDGWNRVVFKTVNDPELSARELYFHNKIAASRSEHLVRLLDKFTDNADKHVMVFPRMTSAEIYGHDLFDIAYIARQLFVALEELHSLGIAHLDITPTNLMSDPNDSSHIEVIDFGLACDISITDDGYLPSRGTCGFVAPEVLSGSSKDLRADIYSAGVVLGMMLQKYLPTVNLRLLGGPLVRSDTTDGVIAKVDELLEAYKYDPEPASFVDCNTTFTQPTHSSAEAVGTTDSNGSAEARLPNQPAVTIAHLTDNTVYKKEASNRNSRCYFDKSDDEAAACAAAYMGGGSIFGGYGSYSDDENDSYPGSNGKTGTNTSNTCNSRSYSNSGNDSRAYGARTGPEPLFRHSNASEMALEQFGQSMNAFESRERYYTASPNNTPVYARSLNEAASSSVHEHSDIQDILDSSPSTSSNIRYASSIPTVHGSARNYGPLALQTYRAVTIRTASSTQSNASSGNNGNDCKEHVKKPGKVPEAVLHAADLLRWTLQANPQCRPTATQALDHPFLASVGIKRKRHRASVNSSPAVSMQDDTSDFLITGNDQFSRGAQQNIRSGDCNRGCSKPAPKDGSMFVPCGDNPAKLALYKTKRSDSGVAAERNPGMDSPMCDEACGSYTGSLISADCSGSRSSSVETAIQRDQGMFKNAAMKDIHLWEREMHSRLAGYPSSIHGDRSTDYESSYSSSSYEIHNHY